VTLMSQKYPRQPHARGRVAKWISIGLLVVGAFAGAGFVLEREKGIALEREFSVLHDDARRLAAERARNQELRAAQIPEAELQRLRVDHAALLRLRREIEALKTRTEELRREASPNPAAGRAGP
jgi:hypothetical protein